MFDFSAAEIHEMFNSNGVSKDEINFKIDTRVLLKWWIKSVYGVVTTKLVFLEESITNP